MTQHKTVRNTPSVSDYAERINRVSAGVTERLFDIAAECAQADAELSNEQKAELTPQLKMGAADFSRMVKIGNHPMLWR